MFLINHLNLIPLQLFIYKNKLSPPFYKYRVLSEPPHFRFTFVMSLVHIVN